MQSFLFFPMFLHKLPHRKYCVRRPSTWHETKLFVSDSCFFPKPSIIRQMATLSELFIVSIIAMDWPRLCYNLCSPVSVQHEKHGGPDHLVYVYRSNIQVPVENGLWKEYVFNLIIQSAVARPRNAESHCSQSDSDSESDSVTVRLRVRNQLLTVTDRNSTDSHTDSDSQ